MAYKKKSREMINLLSKIARAALNNEVLLNEIIQRSGKRVFGLFMLWEN